MGQWKRIQKYCDMNRGPTHAPRLPNNCLRLPTSRRASNLSQCPILPPFCTSLPASIGMQWVGCCQRGGASSVAMRAETKDHYTRHDSPATACASDKWSRVYTSPNVRFCRPFCDFAGWGFSACCRVRRVGVRVRLPCAGQVPRSNAPFNSVWPWRAPCGKRRGVQTVHSDRLLHF